MDGSQTGVNFHLEAPALALASQNWRLPNVPTVGTYCLLADYDHATLRISE